MDEDALTSESYAGDCACAWFGEKAFMDGKASEGWLYADELTSIGELALAEKLVGDVATGVI